jgi:hypothetical protein
VFAVRLALAICSGTLSWHFESALNHSVVALCAFEPRIRPGEDLCGGLAFLPEICFTKSSWDQEQTITDPFTSSIAGLESCNYED